MGLLLSYLCLFGNEMLLTSFFAACLLSVTAVVLLEPLIEKLRLRLLIWVGEPTDFNVTDCSLVHTS